MYISKKLTSGHKSFANEASKWVLENENKGVNKYQIFFTKKFMWLNKCVPFLSVSLYEILKALVGM